MTRRRSPDVAVIGAGVFGAWTARELRRAGLRVALIEAHSPAHARASSGGESRIVRAGYGSHEPYTRWSLHSLREWRALHRRAGEPLFHRTGVLWIGRAHDPYALDTLATLRALRVPHQVLDRAALRQRFPQCRFQAADRAVLETTTGVLMARRAVQALVRECLRDGVSYLPAAVAPPRPGAGRRLAALELADTGRLTAGAFVFACGPWLPRLFPGLLRGRIVPTRQEVYFFGAPAGDGRFAAPHLPAWVDFPAGLYGLPDLEGRGVKLAFDRHGPAFDPERGPRSVSPASVARARRELAARFPALANAPLLETRVCQYENTWNGDFLIDRHPELDDVWLVGGGSGHGFKHGPAVGRHAARLVTGRETPQERFRLASHGARRRRAVF